MVPMRLKLLGVDAGIRDGYRTAMAGMAGMAVAGKAGGKVAHATSSGVKGIQNTFLQIKEQKMLEVLQNQ